MEREHEAAIAAASAAGAGILIRGGAARGAPTDWSRARAGLPVQERWEGAALDELLDGMDRIEFTLRFTLSNSDLDTTIVGTSNPEHLAANLAIAAKGPLPDAVVSEAKRHLAAAGSAPEPV